MRNVATSGSSHTLGFISLASFFAFPLLLHFKLDPLRAEYLDPSNAARPRCTTLIPDSRSSSRMLALAASSKTGSKVWMFSCDSVHERSYSSTQNFLKARYSCERCRSCVLTPVLVTGIRRGGERERESTKNHPYVTSLLCMLGRLCKPGMLDR